MITFHYKAMGPDMNSFEGCMEAEDSKEVVARIRAMGMIPMGVRVHKKQEAAKRRLFLTTQRG